jgi:hypothetical protein
MRLVWYCRVCLLQSQPFEGSGGKCQARGERCRLERGEGRLEMQATWPAQEVAKLLAYNVRLVSACLRFS